MKLGLYMFTAIITQLSRHLAFYVSCFRYDSCQSLIPEEILFATMASYFGFEFLLGMLSFEDKGCRFFLGAFRFSSLIYGPVIGKCLPS